VDPEFIKEGDSSSSSVIAVGMDATFNLLELAFDCSKVGDL
jgi:hypothetical protein